MILITLFIKTVQNVLNMLEILNKWVDEIQPIQQPQRFGNKAFRDWFAKVKEVFNSKKFNLAS